MISMGHFMSTALLLRHVHAIQKPFSVLETFASIFPADGMAFAEESSETGSSRRSLIYADPPAQPAVGALTSALMAPTPAPSEAVSDNETTTFTNGTCSGKGDFSGSGFFEGDGLFLTSTETGGTFVGKTLKKLT